MTQEAHRSTQTVYQAGLRYNDAAAALDWLAKAFGFEETMRAEGEGGSIDHAEMRVGTDLIMLGSASDGSDGRLAAPAGTGVTYVYVEEPDAHHERATAAGASIVRELDDTPYGSREYTCKDPEGNIWSFGTYRP